MAQTVQKAFALADLALRSTWVNGSGSGYPVTSRSSASGTRSLTVTIPDDATVTDASLELTTSGTIGGVRTLTLDGMTLQASQTQTVSYSSTITAPGTYSLAFVFCDNGRAGMTPGEHACVMNFTNMVMTVTYEQPDPEPPVDPDPPAGTKESEGLITLHDGGERNFGASLGMTVLTPTKCTVTETAGGDYSVRLEHPITPDGRWKLIQPWMLVRVPVPMSDTPAIDASGGIVLGYEIWVVKVASAGLYDSNNYIRYPAWEAGKNYAVGAYVRYNGRNYRCKVPNNYSTWVAGCWTNLGSGDPKSKLSLSQDTRLYVSIVGVEWLTVKLPTGETGYCKRAECEYVREATQEDIDALKTSARSIRAQVFRLTDVTVTPQGVTASGQHVSYDFSAQVMAGLTIAGSDLPNAVLDLRANILGATDKPEIYTQDTEIEINTDWSAGSSPVEAILSPDSGLVTQAKARLIRDNWDFFLLQNNGDDRGFRIVYGVNLTGVTWKRDFSSVVTRVIPVGHNTDGSNLYLDTSGGGNIWVESPLKDNYPMVAWKYLDTGIKVGDEDPDGNPYTEATARAEMERQAEACFSESHEDEPQVELEVTFVQLGDADAFSQYKALERVSLYDWVTVEHHDLGIVSRAQVKAYEWDALRRRFDRITLGDVFRIDTGALACWQIADGSITPRKLSDAARAGLSS